MAKKQFPFHNIKADMKAEGESLKKERSEPPGEDVTEARAPKKKAAAVDSRNQYAKGK